MTLSELDAALAEWRDRKRLIDDNLNSFVSLPVFRLLSADSGRTPQSFQGQTQSRLDAAMEVFRGLREQQTVLAQTLDRAAELRASISRLMPARHAIEGIEQILCGPSIELQSSPTRLQHRELLRDVS